MTQVVKPKRIIKKNKTKKNSLRLNIGYPLPVWGLCEDFSIKTNQNREEKAFYWIVKQTMSQNTICTTQSSGLNPDLALFFPFHLFSRCLAHCDFSARRHQTTTAAGSRMPLSLDLPLSSSLCRRRRLCDSRAAKAKPNKSQISALVKNVALPAHSLSLSHSVARPHPIPSKPASGEPR